MSARRKELSWLFLFIFAVILKAPTVLALEPIGKNQAIQELRDITVLQNSYVEDDTAYGSDVYKKEESNDNFLQCQLLKNHCGRSCANQFPGVSESDDRKRYKDREFQTLLFKKRRCLVRCSWSMDMCLNNTDESEP